jgi:hypothetical protein
VECCVCCEVATLQRRPMGFGVWVGCGGGASGHLFDHPRLDQGIAKEEALTHQAPHTREGRARCGRGSRFGAQCSR